MRDIQLEHKVWLDAMYPGQPAEVPLAGLVEEAGELLHAVLKMQQELIWGVESRHSSLRAILCDAIGDCAIYCCSVCNAVSWDFGDVSEGNGEKFFGNALQLSMLLVVHCSDAAQLPVRASSLKSCMDVLRAICSVYRVDFERTVRAVWERVKQRTKKADRPIMVCLCGSTRFKQQYIEANFLETMAGRMVLSVGLYSHADAETYAPTEEEKRALDQLHLRKVEAADEVLVIDAPLRVCMQCGKPCEMRERLTACCLDFACDKNYVGDSTRNEIAHANALGKRVRYWSQEYAK